MRNPGWFVTNQSIRALSAEHVSVISDEPVRDLAVSAHLLVLSNTNEMGGIEAQLAQLINMVAVKLWEDEEILTLQEG
jgi:hypothetical protein